MKRGMLRMNRLMHVFLDAISFGALCRVVRFLQEPQQGLNSCYRFYFEGTRREVQVEHCSVALHRLRYRICAAGVQRTTCMSYAEGP